MSALASLSGTGYALLARQHQARTSAAPVALANTGIAATGKRANGSSLSIEMDATGHVIASESPDRTGKKVSSAAVNLFG